MEEEKFDTEAGFSRAVTRDDIRRAARYNPFMAQCMSIYNNGLCSWEEAMQMLAYCLARDWQRLFEMVIDEKLKNPNPPQLFFPSRDSPSPGKNINLTPKET